MLTAEPWKPEVHEQDFSQVASRVLAGVEPDDEKRTLLLARVTEAQSSNGLANIAEAKALVETLDKLVQAINDNAVRSDYLRVLSEICRKNVILPESYVVSNISQAEKWKIGGAADVWTGKLEEEDVCIKVFRQHQAQQQEKIKGTFFYHAIRWKYVSHENVLPLRGISEVLPPFGLVSPRMPNTNILEYIKGNQDAERLSLLAGAASGVEYLHSLDIVHGGIKPGNILITGKGTACIGDFEIARIITNPIVTQQCATTCRQGVVRYMAPEQVNPKSLGMASSEAVKESDVYSFAMTAYEILTGREPYAETTGEGPLAFSIIDDNHPPRPNDGVALRWLPDPVWQMLEGCWILHPKFRPPIHGVRQVLQGSIVQADSQTPKDEKPPQSDPPQTPVGREITQLAKRGLWDKVRDMVFGCTGDRFFEK